MTIQTIKCDMCPSIKEANTFGWFKASAPYIGGVGATNSQGPLIILGSGPVDLCSESCLVQFVSKNLSKVRDSR